jgi:integrator complex subunit 11
MGGTGADVGRSCVLVTLGGKNVLFDCGMHMGYQDERRFPDFAYISKERRFTELIDCLIVTHLYGPQQAPPAPLAHGCVYARM